MDFKFRLVPTLFTIISLAILVSLGTWQLQRLAWKEALIDKVEQRTQAEPVALSQIVAKWQLGEDVEYTPIFTQLTFDHEKEAHVFGTWEGVIGWFVFTPAYIDELGSIIYVNRGFVDENHKASPSRPEVKYGGEESLRVEGYFRTATPKPFIADLLAPAPNLDRNEWFDRQPVAFAKANKLDTMPIWIDSNGGGVGSPHLTNNVTRVNFTNRHLEYALTWYGLAFGLLVVYACFSLKFRKTVS